MLDCVDLIEKEQLFLYIFHIFLVSKRIISIVCDFSSPHAFLIIAWKVKPLSSILLLEHHNIDTLCC